METSAFIEIASVIVGIISIIALIKFFGLCSNVQLIAKKLNPNWDDLVFKAREEKFIGNKEKAREYFMRAKYRVQTSNLNEQKKKYYYDNIDKALSEL